MSVAYGGPADRRRRRRRATARARRRRTSGRHSSMPARTRPGPSGNPVRVAIHRPGRMAAGTPRSSVTRRCPSSSIWPATPSATRARASRRIRRPGRRSTTRHRPRGLAWLRCDRTEPGQHRWDRWALPGTHRPRRRRLRRAAPLGRSDGGLCQRRRTRSGLPAWGARYPTCGSGSSTSTASASSSAPCGPIRRPRADLDELQSVVDSFGSSR